VNDDRVVVVVVLADQIVTGARLVSPNAVHRIDIVAHGHVRIGAGHREVVGAGRKVVGVDIGHSVDVGDEEVVACRGSSLGILRGF
jgi:hypothetical protein